MEHTPVEIDRIIAVGWFGWRTTRRNTTYRIRDRDGKVLADGYTEEDAWLRANVPLCSTTGDGMLAVWNELEGQGVVVEYAKIDRTDYGHRFILSVNDDHDRHPSKWRVYKTDVVNGNKPMALALGAIGIIEGRDAADGN